ncbi:MAG: hypothetical protein IJA26_08180 [Clostridia bacterium]|nr:hypothetical protein [Clostridia bacterium]
MDVVSSWDFTLANYGPVWSFMVQFGLLLLFMLMGNILRRTIPFFRKCLIPSALLGGTLLLVVNIITKNVFNFALVDNRLMQVITYHCLAIGFAAMSLKTEKSNHKTQRAQVFEFGALQGGTYMLQAVTGLLITIVFFLITRYGGKIVSYVCGLILPLGFGQGPGNALSWDINYTNTAAAQFAGNGSFGLSLASIGFVVASVFGVLYINIFKKRGELIVRNDRPAGNGPDPANPHGEIPDSESVDKFTLQVGFVVLAYALSFGFMCLLAKLSAFTNSIAWGFNFLWASLAAMLIRAIVKLLRKGNLMHRGYINNYQMDRISGFAFDLMIVAGVSAIEINDIKNYILPIILLSVAGAVVTYIYIRKVSKECFKGFEHEFFLMSFGTLTGTASNGMILMKEVDPGLRTPVSSLYILSNFPAMVMIAPLLFLLGFAGSSLLNAIITCLIFLVLWCAYTLFLFRRRIFKKKYANKPVAVWKEEE